MDDASPWIGGEMDCMRMRWFDVRTARIALGAVFALVGCVKSHDVVENDAGSGVIDQGGASGTGGGGTTGSSGRGVGGATGASGRGASGTTGVNVAGTAGRFGSAGSGRGNTGRNGTAGATMTGGLAGAGAGPTTGGVSHDVSRCMPCQAADSVTGTLEACCTADQKCGVDVSGFTTTPMCAEQNAPGTESAACPSANLMGFVNVPGCCGADGICGLLLTQFGPLGCAHGSAVSMLFGTADTTTRCTP
jgi:hypothetical protein